MDEIRRKVIEATKEELSQKPFNDGKRETIIGLAFSMFKGMTEQEMEDAMIDLEKDFREYKLKVGTEASNPNILWAAEYEEKGNISES